MESTNSTTPGATEQPPNGNDTLSHADKSANYYASMEAEQSPNENNVAAESTCAEQQTMKGCGFMVDTTVDKGNIPAVIRSEDMGPWMVMKYKSRKNTSNSASGSKGKNIQGSRFAPLFDSETDNDGTTTPMTSESKLDNRSEPKIVKIWKQVQEKTALRNAVSNNNFMADPKLKISSPDVKIMPNTTSKLGPLKDISNASSPSKNQNTMRKATLIKKNTHLHSTTTLTLPAFPALSEFLNNGERTSSSSAIANSGHVPLDEPDGMKDDCLVDYVSPEDPDNDKFDDAANEMASEVPNLSSPNGEDMVIS
ncbi:hypothetical protein M0R45_025305 [Rubus argutus]|uniref:Uncharacterized protein n=1 Tax=Rubus argutus TaxID=59490 RepID=A0AAW1WVP4_RUBAR